LLFVGNLAKEGCVIKTAGIVGSREFKERQSVLTLKMRQLLVLLVASKSW